MINKQWIKLSSCKANILEKIKNEPENWILVNLTDEGGIHFLTGNELLLIQFNCLFFQDCKTEDSIDTSWLIFTPNKNSLAAIRDILQAYCFPKDKFSFFSPLQRHGLIRHENEWVHAILNTWPESKIYAKYEGDDVLVFENIQ